MIPITVVFTGCINQQTSLGGPTLYIHGYHGTCSSAPCGGYSRLVSEQEYGKNAWQHGKTSSVAGSWDIMGCFLAMEGFSNLTKDCDWLVVWNMFYFSIYWECHHPNWQTPSFFRGVGWNHQPVEWPLIVSFPIKNGDFPMVIFPLKMVEGWKIIST